MLAVALAATLVPSAALAQDPEPAAAGAPEPAPAPAPTGTRVHLELDRDARVHLYEVRSEIAVVGSGGSAYGVAYRSVCRAPCDRAVDSTDGRPFFVAVLNEEGRLGAPSKRFMLEGYDDANVRVKVGRPGLRAAGWGVMMIGAVGMAVGAGLLAPGILLDRPKMVTGGAVSLGIGSAALIGGIVAMVVGRTRVAVSNRTSAHRRRFLTLR
jgi:hypothetical protein